MTWVRHNPCAFVDTLIGRAARLPPSDGSCAAARSSLLHLSAAEAAAPATSRATATVLPPPLLVEQRVGQIPLELFLFGSMMFGHLLFVTGL